MARPINNTYVVYWCMILKNSSMATLIIAKYVVGA